jgi:hypothetical protein
MLESITFYVLMLVESASFQVVAAIVAVGAAFCESKRGDQFVKFRPEAAFMPTLRLAFRLAALGSLFLFVLSVAADHASSRTICCNHPFLRTLSEAFEGARLWKVFYYSITFLAAPAVVVVFVAPALPLILKKHRGLFTDSLFALVLLSQLDFIWIASMGHAEPNWARGYLRLLVATSLLYALAVLPRPTKVRVTNLLFGISFSFVVPYLMVALRSTRVYEGLVLTEKHPGSTRYLFGLLFVSAFWLLDVIVDWRQRRKIPVQSELLHA